MIWELKLFWSFWGLKWITMFHMHPDSYLNIGSRNKLKRWKSGKDSHFKCPRNPAIEIGPQIVNLERILLNGEILRIGSSDFLKLVELDRLIDQTFEKLFGVDFSWENVQKICNPVSSWFKTQFHCVETSILILPEIPILYFISFIISIAF